MKLILFTFSLFLISFANASCRTVFLGREEEGAVKVETSALQGLSVLAPKGSGYLGLTLPYSPFREIFEDLKRRTGDELKSRGEAHVTILTPPEFQRIRRFVSSEDLEALADRWEVVSTQLSPVCLGRGISGTDKTYFLVLRAPKLLSLRAAIRDLVVQRGGRPDDLPLAYAPHVTVGFTTRDLHESDGVVKDERSCRFRVKGR